MSPVSPLDSDPMSSSHMSAKARHREARGQAGPRRDSTGPQPRAGDSADSWRADRRDRRDSGQMAAGRGAVTCQCQRGVGGGRGRRHTRLCARGERGCQGLGWRRKESSVSSVRQGTLACSCCQLTDHLCSLAPPHTHTTPGLQPAALTVSVTLLSPVSFATGAMWMAAVAFSRSTCIQRDTHRQ